MQSVTLTGLLVALGAGIAVGVQSTIFTVIGRAVGPVRGSLLANLIGGLVGLVIVIGAVIIQGRDQWTMPPRITLLHAFIAVILGLLIVTGIGFAFQRVGVAGGGVAIFVGQMLVGTVVDTLGLAGAQPIPFDWMRALGLVVVLAGVMLLTLRS